MIDVTTCPICGGNTFRTYLETKDYTFSMESFMLKQCAECSLIVTSPQPTPKEIGKYYLSKDYISHSDETNSPLALAYRLARKFTLRWKYKLISEGTRPASLLDYGCGTGDFLEFCMHKGWKVHGVEPSPAALEIARRKTEPSRITATLPSADRQYSVITLWHVLEHIHDLNGIIQTLRSHLIPGGRLFIAVPNPNSWESAIYKENWAAYDVPRHLWHFPKHAIAKLLTGWGFTLIKTVPMKLDAYYISLLSEKYKNDNNSTLRGTINAVQSGFTSNRHAAQTGEYSSLIYIFRND